MMKAIMILLIYGSTVQAQRLHVLALAENGGHHIAYTKRAKVWLDQLAKESNFVIMGHASELFDNPMYVLLFRNAISRASKK
ncbi:hypothetical protein [[Flexibacter] sp. ATCC 35208]|uniref:hypothetical protein n=1 Tax=[Flexibacter] sp. ATCC 35208 TaxID=1936242 RepID=UPI0009C8B14E|nr:hypothetical protein [[Flexibacter] sp. ATCC 35208]OMP79037.1 hypothetical protein BW716_11805 [[Flexibacter] sp. ATCC 35208]